MTEVDDQLGPTPEVPSAVPPARRMRITRVHHITLICADLDRTTGFYRDVLGLALVREGVNDDDPGTRHHWFSAAPDDPEQTLISFLEYPHMAPGTQGTGATHHIALAVASADEVEAWRDYLRAREVPTTEALQRGGLRSLYLRDPDGHIIEIAASAE
jgi:glyoxylase I family protein